MRATLQNGQAGSAAERVSVASLRRLVVARQGYATRFRRATADDVAAAVGRLSCVQLDSISTVDRSHRLALGSRVGAFPRGTVSGLLGSGRLFEYWAHEACLVPIEDWPLFTRSMQTEIHPWWGPLISTEPELAEQVLGAIRERGPLGSVDFEGKKSGAGMWNLKPEKRMLDALWSAGRLVISGRRGFQRLYDLPERVIPDEFLGLPVPSEEEWLRGLVVRAVRGRGALTEAGVKEHYRLRGSVARLRPHVDALVADGSLRRLRVDDGGPDVLVPADADLDGDPAGAVLLTPFDNLLWDRPFAERLFGFRHIIEVYKREHEREYGYYVLPLLLGDRFVGRADLKADRAADALRVRAFHLEPGVRAAKAAEAGFERALTRLAKTLDLSTIVR
jgi:uncharacterized protein